MLEAPAELIDDGLIDAWRTRVQRAAARVGWSSVQTAARHHARGCSLALTAPIDQLFLATEINEWGLCSALFERDPMRWRGLEEALIAEARENADDDETLPDEELPVIDEAAALSRFERLAAREARPRLRALLTAATLHRLPYILDEADLTLGAGAHAVTYSIFELPDGIDEVPWQQLRDVPTAVVTGSNGKTTTVRLLAACARAHGWQTAYNCTDGVFLGTEPLAVGDYSGPAGARKALRNLTTQAAILETARGGILRRGIAMSRARVAVVTNVSPDHFGEYGVDDLAGLADVKLSVAAAVFDGGLLVLNADDPELTRQAEALPRRFGSSPRLGWFSAERTLDGPAVCSVRNGRLVLTLKATNVLEAIGGVEADLGPIASMPLTMHGIATYNVANLAGAGLAAAALGIPAATIAEVFSRFGSEPADNPGRLMRFDLDGVIILMDYAHNPDGLRGFLNVASHLRKANGRLGVLLGQAGNRQDEDIQELARVAAGFRPDLVVVKEDEAHLRGRSPAEVPRIIHNELLRLGFPDSALPMKNNELEAARYALNWARPGDVLALPIHSSSARAELIAALSARA